MFSNINADKDELIQLVLVGQPEPGELIGQPRLVQFAQRVAAEYHLPGMSREQVQAYIAHRLAVAGATREIFTPAVRECVYLASRGLPRVVNCVCDYALVYAFTDGLERVDAGVIEQVHAILRRAWQPQGGTLTGERKTLGNVDLKFYLSIFLRRLPYFIVIAAFVWRSASRSPRSCCRATARAPRCSSRRRRSPTISRAPPCRSTRSSRSRSSSSG